MHSAIALAALAAVAYAAPQGEAVTEDISPDGAAPAGFSDSYATPFQITAVKTTVAVAKRDLLKRAACPTAEGSLVITLADGKLTDQLGRIGYIASNYQFQFDGPPQAGALYTDGFSVGSNNSLALGPSAVFYQCLSGEFYNLYDRMWAPQCNPILINILPCGGEGGSGGEPTPPITQITDGQPQATTLITQISDGQPQGPMITQIGDGQPQAPTATGTPITQIGDGQPQAPTETPITQIGDGQPQAPTGTPITQIGDGQPQAPTGTPITQIGDGQPQAPTGTPITQIGDGQPQAPTGTPITQIGDGQPQAPTGTPITQIGDGQPQAPTGTPITQIDDGQPQAPTGTPITQIGDGQPQAPTSTPITQIGDGQIQAPSSTTPAIPVFTGAANTVVATSSFLAIMSGLFAFLL